MACVFASCFACCLLEESGFFINSNDAVFFFRKNNSIISGLDIFIKIIEKKYEKELAHLKIFDRIATTLREQADLAQLVEQLTCNQ